MSSSDENEKTTINREENVTVNRGGLTFDSDDSLLESPDLAVIKKYKNSQKEDTPVDPILEKDAKQGYKRIEKRLSKYHLDAPYARPRARKPIHEGAQRIEKKLFDTYREYKVIDDEDDSPNNQASASVSISQGPPKPPRIRPSILEISKSHQTNSTVVVPESVPSEAPPLFTPARSNFASVQQENFLATSKEIAQEVNVIELEKSLSNEFATNLNLSESLNTDNVTDFSNSTINSTIKNSAAPHITENQATPQKEVHDKINFDNLIETRETQTSEHLETLSKQSLTQSEDEVTKETKELRARFVTRLKNELSPCIKEEALDSYFQSPENADELSQKLRGGEKFTHVYDYIRRRITTLWGEIALKTSPVNNQTITESDEVFSTPTGNITRSSPLDHPKTCLSYSGDISEDSLDESENDDKNKIMAPQIKGISLKDTLDLIPRFNGSNISLTQFVDGCTEARDILPPGNEEDFARLIRMRLFGDALSCARRHKFKTIDEIIQFFENNFGSSKTYHEVSGELAKIKQRPTESVVVYSNRLREIEKEIKKAAVREGRATDRDATLEKDCIRFFIRGLRWEIQTRMGDIKTLEEAREKAIEIERDFAYTGESDENLRREDARQKTKETRRVNVVEATPEVICNFCGEIGHNAMNCLKFCLQLNNNRPPQSNCNPGNNRFSSFNGNSNRDNNQQSYNRNNNSNGFERNFRYNNLSRDTGSNAMNNARFERPREGNNYYPNRDNHNNIRQNSFNGNSDRFGNRTNFNNNNNNRFNPNNGATSNNNMRYNNNNNNQNPNNTTSNLPANFVCYYCQKPGHSKRSCYKFMRDQQEGNLPSGNGRGNPRAGGEAAAPNARPILETQGASASSTRQQST